MSRRPDFEHQQTAQPSADPDVITTRIDKTRGRRSVSLAVQPTPLLQIFGRLMRRSCA
jgi:hypothetical protein